MLANKKQKLEAVGGQTSEIPDDPYQNEISDDDEPETAVIKFVSGDDSGGEKPVLPTIDLPLDTTTTELESLLNNLLNEKSTTPYSFYLLPQDDNEDLSEDALEPSLLTTTLRDTLKAKGIESLEQSLSIKYTPLSLFKVHPACHLSSELPGHTQPILHTSFSSKGHLATGGGDTTVRFWDTNTQMPDSTFTCHKQHVLCTAWSADAEYFASGDKKGEIYIFSTNVKHKPNKVWDKGERGIGIFSERSLKHKHYVSSLMFQPLLARQHMGSQLGGAFSAANNANVALLLSGSKDCTGKLWAIGPQWKGGKLLQTLAHHSQGIEDVRWGVNNTIYLASRDKEISKWEYDASTQAFGLHTILKGHSHRINSLALSTDYLNRIYTGEDINKYNLSYTKKSGKEYEERLVSCSDDFTIFLWVDSKPLKRLFGHQQPVTQISFSPNGQYLVSCSFDKKIKLWCGLTGNFVFTFTGHVGAVYRVVFSADSALIASASKDSTVKIWGIKDRKVKFTLAEHHDEVYALDWSPERNMMSSGGKDRLLRLWTA